MSVRMKLAAGNWKMNGTRASLSELRAIVAGAAGAACDVAICPPATLIAAAADAVAGGSAVAIGAPGLPRWRQKAPIPVILQRK